MTYSNTQWVFIFHWRAYLSTRAATAVQALSAWLTPRGTTLELNRDEYVKAELLERAQTYQILHGIGVLSVEEIREMERYSVAAPGESLTSGVLK